MYSYGSPIFLISDDRKQIRKKPITLMYYNANVNHFPGLNVVIMLKNSSSSSYFLFQEIKDLTKIIK